MKMFAETRLRRAELRDAAAFKVEAASCRFGLGLGLSLSLSLGLGLGLGRFVFLNQKAAGRRFHLQGNAITLAVLLLFLSALQPFAPSAFCAVESAAPAASAYDTVIVPKVKTSVYVGSVTLTMTPFKRGENSVYAAEYKASVVPFFFFNESGRLAIAFNNEQLARLERGERVVFSGTGKNSGGADRRVDGHATPEKPGAKTGKIKVRVFVTKKISLDFNTTYEFTSAAAAE